MITTWYGMIRKNVTSQKSDTRTQGVKPRVVMSVCPSKNDDDYEEGGGEEWW